jgi:DNA-binding transcriptional ArsR family regulator
MTPSTPRSSASLIVRASFSVQTWTWRPDAARAAVNGTAIADEGRRQRAARAAARSSQLYSAPIGALSPTLDATFFALSDAKRRGILERLGRGPATLSQLASPSGLTLNGIKKHVGVLELAGLVETEKVGRARECRLGPAATLGEAGEWIEAHRRAWEGRMDRFERFVEDAG